MTYKIAIPTYKRQETLQKKTLSTLLRNNINPNKIYLFVADEDEKKIYLSNIPRSNYNKIIVGVKGLRNQRNFIQQYFNNNENIVQFDDDISDIKQLTVQNPSLGKKSHKLKPISNLNQFLVNAFKHLKKNNLYLFGVYPVDNAYFMQDKVTTDLRFIVGPMWGVINRKDKKLSLSIDEKEDVERTLLHYKKDKGVVRYNNITIQTAYYSEKGGMQSENKNRTNEAMKSAKLLVKRYPNYCKLYLGKKSGHPEVRLKDKTLLKTLKKKFLS